MARLLKQQAVGAHVRRLRVQRGISLRALATLTDFSASFMSQVENGHVSPSIASMEKIAAALGVTLGEFFEAVGGARGGSIVRADERQALSSGWSNAQIEALGLPDPAARLDAILITLQPGGRSGRHPSSHRREEFAFVLQGQVVLTLGPEEHRLRRGDAVRILPGELHLWRNDARNPAHVMIVTSAIAGALRGRGVPPDV
jgi:quercetin dioxygenase-like cupin family protein